MQNPLGYLCLLLTVLQPSDSRVCRSIDARNNVTDLEDLRNCTVVEGFVKIVLMEKQFVEADFEPYSFPELREVTEYLLFYRVQGLRSLGKLFPNLEKIGGADLFQDFALVVYEMFSLREIGLSSLREITRGSVNVMKNPSLCFVNTVKWDKITRWKAVRNYDVQNRDNASCPGCPDHCPENSCWSATQCQFETTVPQCHPLCVGRCFMSGPRGCYSCKGYYDPEGNCVHTCPANTYKYLNRRCVTREQCVSTRRPNKENVFGEGFYPVMAEESSEYYVIDGDQCLDRCPPGYEPDLVAGECRPCREGRCHKWCSGAVITSTGEAQEFRGCTHISGSIEITIKSETSGAVHSVLEECLGSIEQITGYLQVSRSSVTDLSFLKNLSVIHGRDTATREVLTKALVIIDNENLQDLWDWKVKRKFTIANGKVYFHYNPKLCLNHIYKLLDVIGYNKTVSNFEIGKESNGDKFPCNSIEINITVIDRAPDRIRVHVPDTEGFPVLRYVVYYTKDPYNNITVFDDLDQCSDYGWKTKDIPVLDSNELNSETGGSWIDLTDLEPDTFYVFYVTTYTINRIGARSGMYRDSTLPFTPSEITELRAVVNSISEVELWWEPPRHVNGKSLEYVVSWVELNEDRAFIDQRNYCSDPMVPDTELYKPEKVRLQVKLGTNSCCSTPQKKLLPKGNFEMLCNDFENVPKGLLDKTKYPSCESYFYSYIYTSPFYNSNIDNEKNKTLLPTPLTTSSVKHFASKKLGRNKNVSTSQNQILGNEPLVKNKSKPKVQSLHLSHKNVVLGDLKHFQRYVISVKACRVSRENDTGARKSENNSCSKTEIITVRTKGNKESDAIPQNSVFVKYDSKKEILEVNWDPPEHPNGLILAFEVEYRDRDLENPEHMKECLTHTQYENNDRKHVIHGLSPGKYEFRIRAISLFGHGPFTEFTAFGVRDKRNVSLLEVFCIMLAVFVVLVLVMVMVSSYVPRPSKGNTVIADVNPNYLYHYVPDHYEIDRDDVEFSTSSADELGVGSFGKVYKGRWKSKNLHCAIKTVNENATADDENEFLIEASIMMSMTNAYFIVEIYGVVSRGKPPLVLMELMENGDLKTYLRKMRETNPITNATMIKMAMEIADGMAYMEAHKVVHRDLAARNCMVSSELTIKVGDFGMARDIYETDYYRKKNKGFLPIRWMAPESLKDGEFTSQSDIWSYGVVLWEIVTMAEQPYQGSSNDQVLHDVIAGRRLGIPRNSPLPLKTLMTTCWRTKPARRSSFMSIVGTLDYYHDEEFKSVAYYHSPEAVATRKGMWEYVEMKPLVDHIVARSPPSTSYRLAALDDDNN